MPPVSLFDSLVSTCAQHLRDAPAGMHLGVHVLRSIILLQHRCRGKPIGASSYNTLIEIGLLGPSAKASTPLSGSILSPLSEWLGDKRVREQALPFIDIVLNLLHVMAPEVGARLRSTSVVLVAQYVYVTCRWRTRCWPTSYFCLAVRMTRLRQMQICCSSIYRIRGREGQASFFFCCC